ncbi:GntR family transcriptional regulator [Achromobacter agilis]|uniref:HTH-type transcriptional regulator LutR n=1 Tax=Achromobacter agilis TaxID=1353888 RepID=A0A446CJ13_9BURK|nr:GntR family transcriptional regulator [Achromobacter agilis]SSW67859.1 HTH-type transcriptional regulator LutR [Achromobacter agilis]
MTLKFDKIQVRPDYVDEVYRVLLDAISDGSLAPGTRLTQEEIAEQFAVSRSPVLQALRLLKKDGLVQDAPGRGVLVAPLDLEWIGKLYEVRGALDALAAKLAVQRGAHIDKGLIAQGQKASRSKNVKSMIDADIAFHNAVYQASGNSLIADSAHLHWVHLRRVMGAVLQSSEQRESIWQEHAAIADAINAGDEARAVALSDEHAERARRNLVERLGEVLEDR